ncbi:MAG: hypothetical protein IJM27_06115 [Eubacterium sp.]|nr:hypothetical protein [Eubacterium sp.]
MRKNMSKNIKIRALALALGAATLFSVTGPTFAGNGFQVEAATNKEESERKEWIRQQKKIIKATYEGILDGFAIAFPNFKPFGPILKYFGSLLFDSGSGTANPNAEVMKRLDELDAEMKRSVQELKNSTYNAIQLTNIGDKYNTLEDKAATIRTRIGNYERNKGLTAEERQKMIADLYTDSEFQSLESAMNGATRCFMGKANDIFDNQTIFEAAYTRACQEVMFSGEAIDITAPYIFRQLNTYIAAYAVMTEVYDAYEAVYGDGSLSESQETMCIRLTGCDLEGNKVGTSVIELCNEYFSGDRFIFVGKSATTKIKLNQNMIFKDQFHTCGIIKDRQHYAKWVETPAYMKNMPLSSEQITRLCGYCIEKNVTVFDLLLNRVGFRIDNVRHLGKNKIKSCWNYTNGVYTPKGIVLLSAGAQELEKHRPGGGKCWVTYRVVDITAQFPGMFPNSQTTVTVTKANIEAHGAMCGNIVYASPQLVFFQNR